MMTTIVIDNNSPQAKQFIKYARTLPFAKIERRKAAPQSKWDKAIAEGAVTVDEFIDELQLQLHKHYADA
jgi:hypothetical protein